MALEWARIAGRNDAVYLNIPSNQLSNRIIIPESPAPLVIAKWDNQTNSGMIALMRIRQVGANIQAMILRISPSNFQYFRSADLYNFAWLDWNARNCDAQKNCGQSGADYNLYVDPQTGQTCNSEYPSKFLISTDPPKINTDQIISTFHQDQNASFAGAFDYWTQAKINRGNSYWTERLNTDPCWNHTALKDFTVGAGDGIFHNISQAGFYKLVALAQGIHKAPVAFIAIPEIRQVVSTSTSSSFIRKKVKTTVSYYLHPNWVISTPAVSGTHTDVLDPVTGGLINPTQNAGGEYAMVNVVGHHTFPVDETLIYQWTKTQSGWTGLFVFVAAIALGAITGGVGFGALGMGTWPGALEGAGFGAVGGLVATGFSPTTSTTAQITPFAYSAYQLNPSTAWSGDQKQIANNTYNRWLSPDVFSTPPIGGGVQLFATKIDFRKALACGGASQATDACTSAAITSLPMSDARYNSVFGEMFNFPQRDLQKYNYPYTPK
ncbi:MAG: hypothetical protein M0Z48_09605 [Nitrospiraceae bacterium]|nr:hypothetical protein [Nitrospiraceae bacterium]